MRFYLSCECCVCGALSHYIVSGDSNVAQSAYMKCDECGCNRFHVVVSVRELKGAV